MLLSFPAPGHSFTIPLVLSVLFPVDNIDRIYRWIAQDLLRSFEND